MKRAATATGKSSNTAIRNNLSGIDVIAASNRIQQIENLETLHEIENARLYRRKEWVFIIFNSYMTIPSRISHYYLFRDQFNTQANQIKQLTRRPKLKTMTVSYLRS